MIELNLHPSTRVLRQFAATCLLLVGATGAERWLRGEPRTGMALVGIAIVVGVLGLVWPKGVRWLFVALTVIAFPIGWVVSQLLLLILFAAVVTPVAWLFKLQGRDRLGLKRSADRSSYWKPKSTPQDIRRYLRQY